MSCGSFLSFPIFPPLPLRFPRASFGLHYSALTLSLPYPSSLARHRLLSPSNPLLSTWGARLPFEVAVGMNGRVWLKAGEGDEEQLVKMCVEVRGR